MPEIVLQPLQPLRQSLYRGRIEQAPEELDNVAQVLERDANLMAFVLRQPGKVFAPLHCLAPRSLDEGRRNIGYGGEQRRRVFRYPLVSPAASLEPTDHLEH